MTFGQTSIGRTVSRTRLLLKKQLWIWPIVAVVLLSIVGYLVSNAIHQTMEDNLRSQLETLLTVERAMLEKWFKVQEASALSLANDPQVREAILKIVAADEAATAAAEAAADDTRPVAPPAATSAPLPSISQLNAVLNKELSTGMTSHDFVGYVVADKDQKIIASDVRDLMGRAAQQYQAFARRVMEGKATVSAPFSSIVMLRDAEGNARAGLPTMFVCAPVRDDNFKVVAILGLRIRPEEEFTDILQLGRLGATGETYAINRNGTMVSNSRFDESLILLGLLPDQDKAASILNVEVRDPGGNMMKGHRPKVRRRELPLTEIAAAAVAETSGVNMQGYRDYQGNDSVGAWTWLPDYDLGVITEIDVDEAYLPLTILKRTFYALYALLGVCAIAIFIFTLVVSRLQRQAQKAAIEARQLGQYRLQEEIGSGAMGVVYKGQHAMLRRPTAIKMLSFERVNETSIARFEREVQITCQLNNPHTIAIYDYGRTPEGVFYYAMEFLEGLNLQKLIDNYGPQPEGRVVSIMKQICSSLYEAHSLGLVHRDIKPANVMLNRRGGEPDVVKVLDFGLVKAIDEDPQRQGAGDRSGTPLYMSPEAIQSPETVDGRSDLYAVGALGYFLLTGQTAFNAQTLADLVQQHLEVQPDSPSQRLGRPISLELEHAILACLEKNRSKRPQTARDLSTMLDRVPHTWSVDDAESWWSRHERGQPIVTFLSSALAQQGGAATSARTKDDAADSSSTAGSALDGTTIFNPNDRLSN